MKKASWLTLGFLTAISRVLGLARDVVCAHVFGASADFDAFIVAFQIPNFMRRLFAEGAMAQAFVPIYSSLPKSRQKAFASMTLTLMLVATMLVVLVAWFAGKALICLYAPGFARGGQLDQAINMLHWTMPYITAISIVTICSGINNTHDRFALTGAIPIALNIVLIIAAMLSQENIMLLAYGVFIAGLIQAMIMLLQVRKFFSKLTFSYADSDAKQLVKLMGLGAIAAVIGQLGVMLDTFLASWLAVGTVSAIYFAQRLVFLPIGVIAVAIATVLTPALAKNAADGFIRKLSWGAELVWKISWPASFGLAVLAPLIVKIIFKHGAFDAQSASLTTNIIIVMATGLPAFMLNKVLVSGLYAQKKVKQAITVMTRCLLVNFILGVVFMLIWQQTGIVLATVLSAWLQTIILTGIFRVRFVSLIEPLASLIMATILYKMQGWLVGLPASFALGLLIISGLFLFEACLRLQKKSLLRELKFSDEVL